jgi:hypothetical protein
MRKNRPHHPAKGGPPIDLVWPTAFAPPQATTDVRRRRPHHQQRMRLPVINSDFPLSLSLSPRRRLADWRKLTKVPSSTSRRVVAVRLTVNTAKFVGGAR